VGRRRRVGDRISSTLAPYAHLGIAVALLAGALSLSTACGSSDHGAATDAGERDSRAPAGGDAGSDGGVDARAADGATGHADGSGDARATDGGPREAGSGSPPSPVQAGTSLACTAHIGAGSGALNYPTMQSTLGLKDGDVVCIAPGTYAGGATFSNVSATKTAITLQNDPSGTVAIGGPVTLSNLENVVFSGAGRAGTLTGISVSSAFSDDIDVGGTIDGLTIQNVDLQKNVRYGIYVNNDALAYKAGDVSTYFNDIHILNVTDYATVFTAIAFGPAETISASTGFVSIARNVEIAHSDFGGITPGTVIDVDDVMASSVHHNRFLHINKGLDDHNALIFLTGYGDIYANYSEDYQGEGARVWPWNIDGTGAVVNVYDNINLDSVKYSALEFQPQATYLDVLSILTPAQEVATCNAFGNTAGNLDLEGAADPSECGNTAPDEPWFSAYIDVYDNGTVNLTDNLVFNTSCPSTGGAEMGAPEAYGGHMVNYEGNIVPNYSHNLYFATWEAAGLTSELGAVPGATSPAKGAGASVPGLTTDFYGTPRADPPTVGAVEAAP
jgi:hypothetical protein